MSSGRTGARHLDAPIFGSPQQACEAQVFFAVSGHESDLAVIAPVLETMSRGHRYVGGDGAACTVKALQNGLGLVHAVATAEVLGLCRRLGLDVKTFIDVVVEARGLGCSPYFEGLRSTGFRRLRLGQRPAVHRGQGTPPWRVTSPARRHSICPSWRRRRTRSRRPWWPGGRRRSSLRLSRIIEKRAGDDWPGSGEGE